MEQTEIDELRRLHEAATPAPWNGTWNILTDDGDPIARTDVSLASDPAIADNDGPLIVAARNALPRLLAALEEARAERDDAVALIDAAKSDTRPESFLEHAQAILAKCVAPYSCEQMKAVGDAMAQWYRKWELSSEVAMKACEDRDAAESLAWDALGRPDGTHAKTNVQRLCEAYGVAKAKLEEREADMHARIRAGYDATIADSWRAKVAEVEAKLAALVEACEMALDLDSAPGYGNGDGSREILSKTLAAAKVQP